MKKVISVIIAITMITCLFAGCAASSDSGVYKIAIVQQLDHASLDEIRTSVEAELDAIASEKGIRIEYKEYNGQNDSTVLNQIGAQVMDGDFDAIIPIATLAAQCMVTAAEAVLPEKPGRRQRGGSQIPMHKGNHPFIIMDQSLRIDPVAHQREGVVGGYPAAAGVRAGAKPIAPLLRRDIPLVIDQIAHFDFSSGWAAM